MFNKIIVQEAEINQVAFELEDNKTLLKNFVSSLETGLKSFDLRMGSFTDDVDSTLKIYRKEGRIIKDNLEQVTLLLLNSHTIIL